MLPLFAVVVISTTISSASTGGNVVQQGNLVDGSSYSSVSVQTYSNDEGGTSTVEIETDDSGQVNKQTYTKSVPPGDNADIYVATSTGGSNVQVESIIGTDASGTPWHGRHATSTPLTASSTAPLAEPVSGFGLFSFFNSLFGWDSLRFW